MTAYFHNESHARSRVSGTVFAEPLPELELLRGVLDSFATGVVVLDRDLRYLVVNEAAAALNGLSVADHIGRHLMDVLPEVFPLAEPFYREVFRTGKSIRQPPFQAATQAKPTGSRWWDVRYHPVIDSEGSIIAVTAIFVDASEKVAAESKLACTMHEMRTVLDVVPVGLAIAHDVECREVELNGAYKRMLRLAPETTFEEWTDQSIDHRFTLNGEEAVLDELPMRKAARTGEPTDADRLDVSFPSGGAISMLVRAAPLVHDGVVQGSVAAYVDITDLVRIQDQLTAANRVQYDFLAMVSHELRTPMTMILGNAQLLSREEGAFPEDERRSLAAEVHREAVSLSRIVDNLLMMTRIDHGDRLESEPLVLRHICNKVIQELPFDSASRCRRHYPDDLALVNANLGSVEQVMRNLLSNALKYSAETEMVDLTLEVRGNDVVFSVADRGLGILAEDRERIFDPFFRAQSTSTRSGMGIGLAVCKRLLDAMGGMIWAEARDGGGSVFSFSLTKMDASDIP